MSSTKARDIEDLSLQGLTLLPVAAAQCVSESLLFDLPLRPP